MSIVYPRDSKEANPPFLYPDYKSTVRRAPVKPLEGFATRMSGKRAMNPTGAKSAGEYGSLRYIASLKISAPLSPVTSV